MRELTIHKNDADQRLDRFLLKAVPLLPASLAQKYIRLKRIKVNGARAERDYRLREGDAIHSLFAPVIDEEQCVGCGLCARQCAHGAISFSGEKGQRRATIDHNRCVGCGRCVGACRDRGAIQGPDSSNDVLNCKISEYA